MADAVAQASPARAQTEVVIPQAADAIMPAAPRPVASAVPLYECRRCKDRLPATAFGSHANGQQHVRCRACNVGVFTLTLELMLICSEGIYKS